MSVATLVLAMQMRPLREQARELALRKALPYIGQVQPTLRAASLGGDSVTIGETRSHRAQLLLIFSPSCPFCRQSMPAWQRAAAQLATPRDSVDVVWLSLGTADSTRAWADEHQVREPVLLMPKGKPRATWRIKGVPLTLVLDWQGQVRYVRGAVIRDGATVDSIVRAARTVSAQIGAARPTSIAAQATFSGRF
jgi:peroxiredoxin